MTGVDKRSEAALRSDKRKDVASPFAHAVFYAVLDSGLAKAAGDAVTKEIGITMARGLDHLPIEGASRMRDSVPKYLAALK